MLTIKILGPGCSNCRRLEQVARQAAESLNIPANVVKVTDMQQILAYDLLQTPGLVIDEKLVSSGRIPTAGTIAEWIKAAEAGKPGGPG
jgi:small redox-active disulfide protein 2